MSSIPTLHICCFLSIYNCFALIRLHNAVIYVLIYIITWMELRPPLYTVENIIESPSFLVIKSLINLFLGLTKCLLNRSMGDSSYNINTFWFHSKCTITIHVCAFHMIFSLSHNSININWKLKTLHYQST